MKKIYQIALLTLTIFCLTASSACSIRKNNEKFFYKKTLLELNKSLTSLTLKKCNVSFRGIREPKFIYDETLKGSEGFTFYNEISYKTYDVIPHEVVHYLRFSMQLNDECMEEILGDVLARLVHER